MRGKKKCKFICFLKRFLYTNEIEKLASENVILKSFFLGAFPADVFPKNITENCCWIWNTDESDSGGRHWIAIWLSGDKMYFFDSFAKSVDFYRRDYWLKYAKKQQKKFIYVQKQPLQSKITYTCGYWSLLYLYEKCKNIENANHWWKWKNNKIKIKNEINLKKKIDFKFGSVVDKLIIKKCKSKKESQQCCRNFMESFIK